MYKTIKFSIEDGKIQPIEDQDNLISAFDSLGGEFHIFNVGKPQIVTSGK
jgi:hypothetical protein